MYRVELPRLGTFDAWRNHARTLALGGARAEDVEWTLEGEAPGLFGGAALPTPRPDAVLNVPKSFPDLARQACASREPGVFFLLYRLLLRLSSEPRLLSNRADADVQRAEEIAKNIRRDMHKMKAFVRFREVASEGGDRRQFLSWFEPDHRIEELVAGFFTRRFSDMDWAIVTPEVTTTFRDGVLAQRAIPSAPLSLEDETEELWRTYYANIFNPARLKTKAMQAEMPKKYWKNLPEAALIPGLIADAESRMRQMQESAPTLPPLRAERILHRLPDASAVSTPPADGLNALIAQMKGCRLCPLYQNATQVVPGAGPEDATLMIVGEQPGDKEDLAGRPFIGPAGQAFDTVAREVGLNRQAAYVTNAVKHFKFQPRGKRRIHQSPNTSEVNHCRWWLDREIAQVKPKLLLALGATAALALTGNGKNITRRRGTIEQGSAGIPVFITVHPAFLLRQSSDASRDAETARFREDLRTVAAMVSTLEADTAGSITADVPDR